MWQAQKHTVMKKKTKLSHKIQLSLVIIGVIASLWLGLKLNHKEVKKTGHIQKASTEQPIVEPIQSLIGKEVPHELVCMVNDSYMAEQQIPVPVKGKMYYGCCQGCVVTLNEKENIRLATDPFSGEQVDKADAYIVLLDEQGTVGYFESQKSYESFKSK